MAYRRTVGRSRGRRSSSLRRFSSPRQRVWVRAVAPNPAPGVVADYGFILIPDLMLDPGARVGSTVLRIHGTLQINCGAVTKTDPGFFFGIAVTDVNGFNLPAQPPILPYTHMNGVDWMAWGYFPVASRNVGYYSSTSSTTYSYPFDVKSKRRITQPQENLVLVFQNNGIEATVGLNLSTSTLLALS